MKLSTLRVSAVCILGSFLTGCFSANEIIKIDEMGDFTSELTLSFTELETESVPTSEVLVEDENESVASDDQPRFSCATAEKDLEKRTDNVELISCEEGSDGNVKLKLKGAKIGDNFSYENGVFEIALDIPTAEIVEAYQKELSLEMVNEIGIIYSQTFEFPLTVLETNYGVKTENTVALNTEDITEILALNKRLIVRIEEETEAVDVEVEVESEGVEVETEAAEVMVNPSETEPTETPSTDVELQQEEVTETQNETTEALMEESVVLDAGTDETEVAVVDETSESVTKELTEGTNETLEVAEEVHETLEMFPEGNEASLPEETTPESLPEENAEEAVVDTAEAVVSETAEPANENEAVEEEPVEAVSVDDTEPVHASASQGVQNIQIGSENLEAEAFVSLRWTALSEERDDIVDQILYTKEDGSTWDSGYSIGSETNEVELDVEMNKNYEVKVVTIDSEGNEIEGKVTRFPTLLVKSGAGTVISFLLVLIAAGLAFRMKRLA